MTVIDPNRVEKKRYGIQGQLRFDPGGANTNVPLYNQIKKFMSGEQGLGGSGGELANRLETGNAFSQSNVFKTSTMRKDAEERLNKQLEEYLEKTFGEQAQAQSMNMPEFLTSQGISGAQYRRDSFIESSQNPITGSSERKARAYMKQIGAQNKIIGGSNEDRRQVSFLRAEEAKRVNSYIDTAAEQVNTGTYNKSDFEGLYGSTEQRISAKSKRNEFRNNIAIGNLDASPPAVLEEYKSRALKQHKEKQLVKQAEDELRSSGDLPPLEEKKEKEKKESVVATAAKGMFTTISKIASTIQTIQSGIFSSLAYLQKMAGFLGAMLKDKGALGIGQKEAEQLREAGRLNSVYSGGNANFLLDAGKSFVSSTGDILKGEKLDYRSPGLHDNAELIDILIKGSVEGIDKPKPIDTMKKAYGYMAEQYYKTPAKQRDTKLAELMLVMDTVVPGSGQGLNSVIQWGDANGIDSKSARHIVSRMMGEKEGSGTETAATNGTGGRQGSVYASKASTKTLNEINAVITLIEDSIGKMILANMNTIIKILLAIGGGLLKIAAFAESDEHGPAHQALKDFRELETNRAEKGFRQMKSSAAKVKKVLLEDLAANGYTGQNAEKLISDFNKAEDPAQFLADTHKPFLKKNFRDIVIGLSQFREISEEMTDYTSQDPKKPKEFVGDGDLDNYYRKNTKTLRNLRKLGFPNPEVNEKDFKRVNNKKTTDDDMRNLERAIKGGTYGFTDPMGDSLKKIGGLATKEALNLDPSLATKISSLSGIGKLSSVGSVAAGAGLSGESHNVLTHNFNLTVNGKEVFTAKQDFDTDSANRFLQLSNQGKTTV